MLALVLSVYVNTKCLVLYIALLNKCILVWSEYMSCVRQFIQIEK